jgi:cytochrome c biogenesis factor
MKLMSLKILFSALSLFMVYMVVSTSLESNLIKEWSFLGSIPWMRATLFDFYTNIIVLYAWVVYKEMGWMSRIVWFILFVGLGSITVTLYVVIQLMKLKPGEGIEHVLLRRTN